MTLVVCTGLRDDDADARPPPVVSWVTAVLLGSLMAVALLLQAAHWADRCGRRRLVGVTVLAMVIAFGADRWCRGARTAAPEYRAARRGTRS